MRKLLLSGYIVALLFPVLAFAAYNDVSLTTDTSLSVNGITVNVSGSPATIESIEAGSTTFTFTLQANSSVQFTAPSRNILATDQQSGLAVDTCNDTESVLGYTASSSQIIAIITPSATLCTSPAAAASVSSGPPVGNLSGGGGGGGGGGTTVTVPVTQTVTPVLAVQAGNAEAIVAIKTQLIALIQQLIAELIQQLQAQIQAIQAGSN